MSLTLVIFGASGDLTSRKLVPALYQLFRKGRLPAETRIVGFSRTAVQRRRVAQALAATTENSTATSFDAAAWEKFAPAIHYQPGDIGQPEDFEALHRRLASSNGKPMADARLLPGHGRRSSTRRPSSGWAPAGWPMKCTARGGSSSKSPSAPTPRRPGGSTRPCTRVFREKQVYRIDHYLGKETVQNILVLRFANTIFEPVWNRNYIDHVQITVAEEVTVGRRGDFYDETGVLRDMFQNHLLQLLMTTAMEAPVRFEADAVRDEKVKVLRAIPPLTADAVATDTMRGQYEGYRQEPGVAADSQTATFAAVKLAVDNWRWQGVPFYLRSGKAMSCRTTQIVIQFRSRPRWCFGDGAARVCDANRLVIQIQPAEGIQLHFQTKVPDAGMKLRLTDLEFSFQARVQGRDARGLRAAAARRVPGRRQPVCPERRSGTGLGHHRPDHRRLAIRRPAAAGDLRAGHVGPDQRGSMDGTPMPGVVRRLPGHRLSLGRRPADGRSVCRPLPGVGGRSALAVT